MAYGQINPWVAGRDELLRVLATREQRAIEAQKRAFEEQRIEQEMALRQQQAEDTAAAREAANETLRIQREAAAAAAKAQEDQRRETTRNNRAQAEQIAYIVSHPEEFDPNVVKAAQFMQIGVKPTADVQTGRNRADEILAASEASMNRMLAGIDAREAARDARERRDNPSYPRGVADYVGALATKYGPNSYGRAAQELTSNWANVKTAHPDADLATALAKLKQITPYNRDEDMAPMDPTPTWDPQRDTAALGKAAGTQPMTVNVGPKVSVNPAGDQAGVAAAAGKGPLTVNDVPGRVTPEDAAAVKFLQANGAPVTPANIAAVKQRLAAGR